MAVYIGVVLLGAVLFLVQYNLYCSVATHLQGIRFAGFVGDTGQSTEQGRSCEGVEAWVCPVSLITWKILHVFNQRAIHCTHAVLMDGLECDPTRIHIALLMFITACCDS